MAQYIDDVISEDTEIVPEGTPLTVGLLKATLADLPDDYEVVFPLMIGDLVSDNWARATAILSDPDARLVGIAIS